MGVGRSLPLAVVAVLLLASPSAASDRGEVLLLRARTLAGEGRCTEALPVLERAREAAPNDARVALLTGRCLLDERRYAEALDALDRARSLDPSLADVDLYRAMALYHLERTDEAWDALQAAEGRATNEALLQLYRGLVLLQREETREGVLALERARRADPRAVEPVASFYSMLAWQSLEDERRAREALARVQSLDPGGPWAAEAERALERIDERRAPRWWARASAGVEWDSNVGLFGTGVVLPGEISRREDVRAVLFGEVGVELLRTEDWTVGALGTWESRLHDELDEFDTHYPGGSLWVDRRLGEDTLLRVRYDTAYGWYDDWDPLVYTNAARTQLFHDWGRPGDTELVVGGYYNAFFATDDVSVGPPGEDTERLRDRDGPGLRVGVHHVLPLGFREAQLSGGYFYNRYWAEGREWKFHAHEVRTGASMLLPLRVVGEANAAFTYAPFDHASTYPDPGTGLFSAVDRLDKQWLLSVGLERAFGEHLSVSARYTYVDNKSNVSVFDYQQEIVGGYITVRFP